MFWLFLQNPFKKTLCSFTRQWNGAVKMKRNTGTMHFRQTQLFTWIHFFFSSTPVSIAQCSSWSFIPTSPPAAEVSGPGSGSVSLGAWGDILLPCPPWSFWFHSGSCCWCRGPGLSKHHCSSYRWQTAVKTKQQEHLGFATFNTQISWGLVHLGKLTCSPVSVRNSHQTGVGSSLCKSLSLLYSPRSKTYSYLTMYPFITWYAENGCHLLFSEFSSNKYTDSVWIQQYVMK